MPRIRDVGSRHEEPRPDVLGNPVAYLRTSPAANTALGSEYLAAHEFGHRVMRRDQKGKPTT